MATGRLIAVSTGQARPLFAEDGGERFSASSAISKRPVSTLADPRPCEVTPQGLSGDESVEHKIHGPPLQAVYVYPAEHYEFWRSLARQHGRPEPAPGGALGENLTIEGLSEVSVWIGDTLAIGTAAFRVTRPREPCFKLNAHLRLSMASKMMVQSGFTGFYCAVLRTGTVAEIGRAHV